MLPSSPMVPYAPAPPVPHGPDPLTCPGCGDFATPKAGAQVCPRCQRRFTLTAGPALDPAAVPRAPNPMTTQLFVRWSIVVTYRVGRLDPLGITSGTLDPVAGIASLDEVAIGFQDVCSIAVWRRVAWTEVVAGCLVPLPVALFFLYCAVSVAAKAPGGAAVLGLLGLLFGVLAAFMLRRGLVVGRRYARVVGRWRELTVRFEKNPSFYDELFRRCGLAAPPVP